MHNVTSDSPPGDNARVKKSAAANTDFYIRIPIQDVECPDLISVQVREPGDKSDRPLFCGNYLVLVGKCREFVARGARVLPEFIQGPPRPVLDTFYADLMKAPRPLQPSPSTDQHQPGAKLDNGKVRLGLIMKDFHSALYVVAQVATFGAEKYTPHGWFSVPNGIERYTDAMYRHLNDDAGGVWRDPESQLPHLAHAAWNALAVLELELRKAETQG